jgi:tetratricopeptide (TPR) repeat protein
MSHVQVFISSVSAEFNSYREDLRHLLERPNVSVKVQEDFIAGGTVTLEKLDTYIASCTAMVHLVGDCTGSPINASSLAWIRQQYPQLADRLPALADVLFGTVTASYTQWESYLALYHGKVLLVATPIVGAVHNGTLVPVAGDAHQSQTAHLKRLRMLGVHPEIHFGTADRLAAEIALSTLLDLLVAAGIKGASLLAALQPRNLPLESLGPLFKGRDPFLRRLHQNFTDAGSSRQAIYGLGGIGKTRLAVEYAWQFQAHYNTLLFVIADSPVALLTNLANLCSPLVLNLPEASTQEQDMKLGAVLRWLQQHPGWLLILDNVDTLAAATAVEKLLAQLNGGQVLLTTRLSEWSKQVQCLELEMLQEEAAEEFLLERTVRRQPTLTDATDARALARDVGQLALALEQASAYIEAKRITLQVYRRRWATNYKAVREWSDDRLMGYAGSVAVTWQTSFDQLTPAARTLLNRLSWLSAEPIPITLLEVLVPEAEVVDMEDAREDLARYSLITYAADSSAISVHCLVQEVTRARLNAEEQLRTFKEALGWIDTFFREESKDVNSWHSLNPLQTHALAIVTYAQEFNNPEPTSHLLSELGLLLSQNARLTEAEPLLRRALNLYEARYGSYHYTVAIALDNLAQLLRNINRWDEAESLLRRALEMDENGYGPYHPTVAIRLNNLGQLLMNNNSQDEAESLLRRALKMDENGYGPYHPALAPVLDNLAQLLMTTNRRDEAEPLLRRALAITEHSCGPDHPEVATRLNNLAQLLAAANCVDEAELLLRRALAITEHSCGPDHPTVTIVLRNLAQLLVITNRWTEVEPLYRRALIILIAFEKRASYLHPYFQTVSRYYVYLLRQMNQNDDNINRILKPLGYEVKGDIIKKKTII